jgi:hypothetical protein
MWFNLLILYNECIFREENIKKAIGSNSAEKVDHSTVQRRIYELSNLANWL